MNTNLTKINYLFFLTVIPFLLIFCSTKPQTNKIKLGADRLIESELHLIAGKRVGVITNQTGVNSTGIHIVDLIYQTPDVKLVAIFGPEHGVRGDVEGGFQIGTLTDSKTGVPIFSLYGETRKPNPEMLRDIDVMIFDILDIGTRFYTYISTMSLAMEACAENNISFIVLDRPNPITGTIVEGPVLVPGFESFVGIHPIALRYGMTVGELAQLFNGEGFLKEGQKVNLNVVKMKNWKRDTWLGDFDLNWIKPSPNITDDTTTVLYPGVALLEGTVVSEGRGTPQPFKNIGAPWLDHLSLQQELQLLNIPGIHIDTTSFVPVDMPGAAVDPKFEGQKCHGLRFRITDPHHFQSVAFGIHLICLIKKIHPEHFAWNAGLGIDRLSGTDKFRKAVDESLPAEQIIVSFENEVNIFKKVRQQYLLY